MANGNGNTRKVKEQLHQAEKAEQRRRRNTGRGLGEPADWSNADAELLREVIAVIGARGCAVQFGYTRDGSAYTLRFVGDGEPFNEYVRPAEDINLHLRGIIEDYKL